MAANGNTDIVLQGIGSGMLISATDKSIVPIDYGTDLSAEVTVSSEDVFGGDSLFPIFTFIKEKGGKVTITDATFKLNMLKATQAATLTSGGSAKKMVTETITVATGTSAQLTATSGVSTAVGDTVAYKVDAPDTAVLQVVSAPTGAVQFTVTAAGVITFGSSTSGQYVFSYYVTDANAASATIKTNVFPGHYELRWRMVTKDRAGNNYAFDLRATNVTCTGGFTVDLKRGTASAQKLEFKILAPSSGTDFINYTIAPVAA